MSSTANLVYKLCIVIKRFLSINSYVADLQNAYIPQGISIKPAYRLKGQTQLIQISAQR